MAVKDPFQFITLKDLRASPPPEVHFLWGDRTNGLFQEKSYVMLHASEKTGKSMFTLNLAVAGARGDSTFLGIPLRHRGFSTLIVQCEVHMRAVYERFEQMLQSGELTNEQAERITLNAYRSLTLSDGDNISALRTEIRKRKPDVVVVDPLARMLTDDENSNVAVGRGLAPLLKLRDNPGCAVIVVHHDSKVGDANAGRPAHQRSRGANRLTADPDSIWSLTRTNQKGSPTAKFECLARYGAQMSPFRIRMNPETFWFETYSKEDEYGDDVAKIIRDSRGSLAETSLIETLREKWNLHDEAHNDRTLRQRLEALLETGRFVRYEVGSITVWELSQGRS